jgi:type II secretory pathway pseudopilin PulG
MNEKKGFSSFEILAVIGIVIILILVAIISLDKINKKVRDNKRTVDIEALQTAFAGIKNETGNFLAACGGTVFNGPVNQCVGSGDDYKLKNYLPAIAFLNDPSEKDSLCDDKCSFYPCNYSLKIHDADHFELYFFIENNSGDYHRGCHVLNEQGIK